MLDTAKRCGVKFQSVMCFAFSPVIKMRLSRLKMAESVFRDHPDNKEPGISSVELGGLV